MVGGGGGEGRGDIPTGPICSLFSLGGNSVLGSSWTTKDSQEIDSFVNYLDTSLINEANS